MDMTKLKFLVADDSAMARELMEKAIKGMGVIRIDKVENGKEALLKIKKSFSEAMPYSLICLDWEMPEMTGFDLLRVLRADPVMKNQSVLMVSSIVDPEQLLSLATLQPNGYLVKPFAEEIFRAKVTGLLSNPRKGSF